MWRTTCFQLLTSCSYALHPRIVIHNQPFLPGVALVQVFYQSNRKRNYDARATQKSLSHKLLLHMVLLKFSLSLGTECHDAKWQSCFMHTLHLLTILYIVGFPGHHKQPEQCLLICSNPAAYSDLNKDDIQPMRGRQQIISDAHIMTNENVKPTKQTKKIICDITFEFKRSNCCNLILKDKWTNFGRFC